MRLKSDSLICGVKARDMRDLFRRCGDSLDLTGVRHWLGFSKAKASDLLRRLQSEGYINPANEAGWHELNELANAVKNVRFVKPISRARADEIVSELLERIEAINANGELVYFVEAAVAFGSYADPLAADVSDIDLIVTLSPRPPITKPLVASSERARRLGRTFSLSIGEYLFGVREVQLLIKARSRYISLHDEEDLRLAKATKRLFDADPRAVANYSGPT